MAGPARVHRFGPRERNGVFGGLRVGQLAIVLGTALVVILLGRVGSPVVSIVLVLTALGFAAGLAFVPIGKRAADQWAIVLVIYLLRALAGHRRWASSAHLIGQRIELPLTPRPAHEVSLAQDLPPSLEGLRILAVSAVGGHDEVGVICDGRSYIAVLAARGPSFALMDPGEQTRVVAEWSAIIASFGITASPVDRIQWLERTVPEDPTALVHNALAKIPELAPARTDLDVAQALARMAPGRRRTVQSYLDGVRAGGTVAQQHEAYVALRLSLARPGLARTLRRAGQGDLERGACEALLREVAALAERLDAADIGVSGALTPRQLAETIRVAYDLGARKRLRRLEQAGRDTGVDALRFGPMALAEFGDHLRTDGSLHATFHVAEWPRRDVGPTFMHPLLLRSRCTRTVAMTMEPVDPLRAHREIERTHVGRSVAGRVLSHYGWEGSFRRQSEDEKVQTVGQELTEGHVSVRFSAYVTVSAESAEELENSCREVERQASQSLLELERLWGQQLPAFTYTLPLARGL